VPQALAQGAVTAARNQALAQTGQVLVNENATLGRILALTANWSQDIVVGVSLGRSGGLAASADVVASPGLVLQVSRAALQDVMAKAAATPTWPLYGQ
jgi:hypothetical protein